MIKLIQEIEKLLYELVLWFVFIPRTLFRIIFTPKWITPFILSELEKDEAKRYESYVSPVIYFILVGVLPLLLWKSVSSELLLKQFAVSPFSRLSQEAKLVALSLFLTSFPLGFSLVILWNKGQSLTRTNLRPIFYAQVMCFATLYFVTFFLPVPLNSVLDRLPVGRWGFIPAVIPFQYFYLNIYAQICVISEQLKNTKLSIALVLFEAFIFSVLLMLFFEVVLLAVIFSI